MNIIQDLLLKIWRGQQMSGDDVIALGLLLAMAASLCHLFTMLVTRWGERHIAAKSLLASLLVHAVCLLGLEVFEPANPDLLSRPSQLAALPEQQISILIESDDNIAMKQSGNTPLADQLADPEQELERLPLEARSMETPEVQDREPEVLDSLNANAQDVSQQTISELPQIARRVDAGAEGRRIVASEAPTADLEATLPTNENDVYVPDKSRTIAQQGDLRDNEMQTDVTDPTKGSVERIAQDLLTEDSAIAMTTTESDIQVKLPDATSQDTMERRAAPFSTVENLESAGISDTSVADATRKARSLESLTPRRLAAPERSFNDPRPDRMNPNSARTPLPLIDNTNDVRSGRTMSDISQELISSAPKIDVNPPEIRRRQSRSATYTLRNRERRREAARRFGGTQKSEAAVERSLKWFSSIQLPDGHWDASSYGSGLVDRDENDIPRNFAGRNSDTGISALIILSYLGAGYTHEGGQYSLQVDRALDWLISQQGSDGNLGGNAGHYAKMYCHAMATYALAEAIGMQRSTIMGPIIEPDALSAAGLVAHQAASSMMLQQGLPAGPFMASGIAVLQTEADRNSYQLRKVDDLRLEAALLRAITFTLSQQDPASGGWRYSQGQEGDVSMFGWQMMSLKSAAIAGVEISPKVRDRMTQFLNSVRQGQSGGLFGYRRSVQIGGQETEQVTAVMTAEALFCQQMLGYQRDSATSRESVTYILKNRPRLAELDFYYWYYGTLAMYQYGGEPWKMWNSVVRDTLISEQRTNGTNAGSWDPNGPWGRYGGRLYSTALATLTLEVYYRLLPLYRMNDNPENATNN
ncbi:MAG: prenyltransferase/squalene oxidase repeat-containing protein [Fuerstiella sp.]